MAEENNAFGKFGARSAKFDELLKKYQTIDEGDTVEAPPARAEKPAVQPQPEVAQETVVQPEAVEETPAAEPEIQPEAVEETPAAEPEVQPEEAEGTPATEPEVQPEAAEETPAAEPEIQPEAVEETPAAEPEVQPEPEPEPDYSYDIDIFSAGGKQSTADIDSFDNSWIDSAIDESVFYRPEPVEPVCAPEPEAYAPAPEPAVPAEDESQAVPVTEYENGYYGYDTIDHTDEAVIDPLPSDPEKDIAAGGYIAPSDFGDFQFDADSGMDFDTDEFAVEEPAPETSKIKDRKNTAREQVDSGKNEMSSVTGFSKNYKASEGKGSKKDGFFVRNFVPKGTDTAVEKIRKIIMIICVLTFVCAAAYLLSDFVIQPALATNRIEKLEDMIGEDGATLNAADYPDVEFPDGMLGKYAGIYAANPDFVGWINIEGLDISLPVVQGEDNKEYLKRDFDGNRSKYGSVFMNSANNVKNLNYNTSLFGHHMLDSKMFGNLMLYKDVENYKKAPVIEFNTIYGDFKWKIFAVFITNGTADGDDGYIFDYTFTDLSSSEAVEKFLGEIDQRAIYKPEVDIAVSDRILTLSTCSYEFDEARFVVMARMVRPGESEAVSGNVISNDNPRYPAAYYEEKGLTNPYATAYNWQPS